MHLFQWMSHYHKHPFVIESNIHNIWSSWKRSIEFFDYMNQYKVNQQVKPTPQSTFDFDRTTSKLQT